MAAAPLALFRHPGRRLLPFSQSQSIAVPAPGRCSRSRCTAAAVAAARKAASPADAADTVADGSSADADEAAAAPKRGRPRKADQTDRRAASDRAAAAPKPRARSKKDAAAKGDGATAAADKQTKKSRKKTPAEDSAVKSLKLSFDQEQVEEQMAELEAFEEERAEAADARGRRRAQRRAYRGTNGVTPAGDSVSQLLERQQRLQAACLPVDEDGTERIERGAMGNSELRWYLLKVNGKKEDMTAKELERRIALLPPLPDSDGEPREAAALAPSKRVRAFSNRTKKMGNKTVRWNEGGKLLLQCVMDEEVYKLVTEQEEFPVPLEDSYIDDVHAWVELNEDEDEDEAMQAAVASGTSFATPEMAMDQGFNPGRQGRQAGGYEADELRGTFDNPSTWFEPGASGGAGSGWSSAPSEQPVGAWTGAADSPGQPTGGDAAAQPAAGGAAAAAAEAADAGVAEDADDSSAVRFLDEELDSALFINRDDTWHEPGGGGGDGIGDAAPAADGLQTQLPNWGAAAGGSSSGIGGGDIGGGEPFKQDLPSYDSDEDIDFSAYLQEEGDLLDEHDGGSLPDNILPMPRKPRLIDPFEPRRRRGDEGGGRGGRGSGRGRGRGRDSAPEEELSLYEQRRRAMGPRPGYGTFSIADMINWSPEKAASRAEQMEAERNAAAAHAAAASLQGVSLPPAADFSADRPYVPPASEPAWQTEGAGGAWYSGDGGQQDAGSSGGSGRGRAEAGSRAETGSGSQQSWEQQPKWRWGERQLGWDQQDRRDGGGGGRFGGRSGGRRSEGRSGGRADNRSRARGNQRFSGNQLAGWGGGGGRGAGNRGARRDDGSSWEAGTSAQPHGWYEPGADVSSGFGGGEAGGSSSGWDAGSWGAVGPGDASGDAAGSNSGSGQRGEAADQVGSDWADAGWGDAAGGGGGSARQQQGSGRRGGGLSDTAGWFSGSGDSGGSGYAADPALPNAAGTASPGGGVYQQQPAMSEFNDFNAPPPPKPAAAPGAGMEFAHDTGFGGRNLPDVKDAERGGWGAPNPRSDSGYGGRGRGRSSEGGGRGRGRSSRGGGGGRGGGRGDRGGSRDRDRSSPRGQGSSPQQQALADDVSANWDAWKED